jgi:hypothetical protein
MAYSRGLSEYRDESLMGATASAGEHNRGTCEQIKEKERKRKRKRKREREKERKKEISI